MFKTAANRTGVFPQPQLDVSAKSIVLLHQTGDLRNATGKLTIRNAGSGSFTWTADFPPGFEFSSSSGVVTEDNPAKITVSVPIAGRGQGTYDLGSITINATLDVGVLRDVQSVHPVQLIIGELQRAFTPIVISR
jgi:hypothetical protein